MDIQPQMGVLEQYDDLQNKNLRHKFKKHI
jgi:hypothetical protein